MNKREVGTFFENAACEYLQQQGVAIIERNFRCRLGEIDLIGKKDGILIFFEVKYRKTEKFGPSLMAVDYKKQCKISKCASYYCMKHPYYQRIRYDVIGITNTKIEWIRDAFPHRGYGFY